MERVMFDLGEIVGVAARDVTQPIQCFANADPEYGPELFPVFCFRKNSRKVFGASTAVEYFITIAVEVVVIEQCEREWRRSLGVPPRRRALGHSFPDPLAHHENECAGNQVVVEHMAREVMGKGGEVEVQFFLEVV